MNDQKKVTKCFLLSVFAYSRTTEKQKYSWKATNTKAGETDRMDESC